MDLPTLLQMSKQKVIQKGIQVTMAVPAPSQETVAKSLTKVLIIVNSMLSPMAQRTYGHYLSGHPAKALECVWVHIRRTLLECFGNHLNVNAANWKYSRITQETKETPNDYYLRLINALGALHTCIDKEYGDGSEWSAAGYPRASYPLYELKEGYDTDIVWKERFLAGLQPWLQQQFELSCGDRTAANTRMLLLPIETLMKWFEGYWNAHRHIYSIHPGANREGNLKVAVETSGYESEAEGTVNFAKNLQKRAKIDQSHRDDQLITLITQQNEDNRKMFTQFGLALTKMNPVHHSPSVPEPNLCHRLQGMNEKKNDGGSANRFRAPSNSATEKKCWSCNGPHYLPQCPCTSRLEILMVLQNRCYRMNRSNPNTNSHTTLDSLLKIENLSPCTDKEKNDIARIYLPLINKQARTVDGLNPKAYCHFCHSSGHWTRDCKSFCPYCKEVGHGWKMCSVPEHQVAIKSRTINLANTHAVDVILTLVDSLNSLTFHEDEDY
jgi:hypothetical protein